MRRVSILRRLFGAFDRGVRGALNLGTDRITSGGRVRVRCPEGRGQANLVKARLDQAGVHTDVEVFGDGSLSEARNAVFLLADRGDEATVSRFVDGADCGR